MSSDPASERHETPAERPCKVYVPRHRWNVAEEALRRSRAAYTASADHVKRVVLVITTFSGAAVLAPFGKPAPANARGWRPPPPRPAPKPVDALELAFRKLAAGKAGRREPST